MNDTELLRAIGQAAINKAADVEAFGQYLNDDEKSALHALVLRVDEALSDVDDLLGEAEVRQPTHNPH